MCMCVGGGYSYVRSTRRATPKKRATNPWTLKTVERDHIKERGEGFVADGWTVCRRVSQIESENLLGIFRGQRRERELREGGAQVRIMHEHVVVLLVRRVIRVNGMEGGVSTALLCRVPRTRAVSLDRMSRLYQTRQPLPEIPQGSQFTTSRDDIPTRNASMKC